MWAFDDTVIVYVDNILIGDLSKFYEWAIEHFNYECYRSESLYDTLCKESYSNYLSETNVNKSTLISKQNTDYILKYFCFQIQIE
jgi:hypothetical protein